MSKAPRTVALVAAVGLATLGCERSPDVAGPLFGVAGANRVVQSVTGSGHFTSGGEFRTFAFNAVRRADGTVTGEYQGHNRAADVHWHGNVTCFTVIGNQAWIGGTTETSSDPNLIVPGTQSGFRVADNGEGRNTPPDQISLQFINAGAGFANAYCGAAPPAPALNDVQAGNIQVR